MRKEVQRLSVDNPFPDPAFELLRVVPLGLAETGKFFEFGVAGIDDEPGLGRRLAVQTANLIAADPHLAALGVDVGGSPLLREHFCLL